jgi:hypothetical protein
MTIEPVVYKIHQRPPHDQQQRFIDSPAKRKVIRAGRRSGKTTGIAILAVKTFVEKRRVLYAAPTQEQIDRFWEEIKRALREPIAAGYLYKNETRHIIEVEGTENRIRAKTAWDADSLRGDYADLLILDEWQLMNEEAWGRVGSPMMADNNGDAVFIYTPPSIRSRSRTKARDPRHAVKLYKKAEKDASGLWAAFHFTSYDNPHINREALELIRGDMTALAFEQEMMAEDLDSDPRALWNYDQIEDLRVDALPCDLVRIVIGVDPSGGAVETGIVVAAEGTDGHGYILSDVSLLGKPGVWGAMVVAAYNEWKADRIVGERNFGGEMVEHTIRSVEGGRLVAYKDVNAARGKAIRAEPVAARYERGLIHHVGHFPVLEDEMCGWIPGEGMPSPNRLDAAVWALTELFVTGGGQLTGGKNPFYG